MNIRFQQFVCKWLGLVISAMAISISSSTVMRDEARAQDNKCAALASQLKALESSRERLKKELQKPGDLPQLKELDAQIRAVQRELDKCPQPMCNGMRECTPAEKKIPPYLIADFTGPNGTKLHGYLYVPGVSTDAQLQKLTKKYPAMIWNHGSEQEPGDGKNLGKLFVDHGFIFFFPHRHGHGLSADAGPWIVDQERLAHNDLVSLELHEQANKDVMTAVNWLKSQAYVDRERIAMGGGSYGGIQTLLTADKDPGLRAYIPFTPGTQSWGNTPLRERLIKAVRNEKAPMFIIQNEGDYTIAPLTTLGTVLLEKGDPQKWKVKLYSSFGCNHEDAHAKFGGTCAGIAIWSPDGLPFLDQWMR